MSTTTTTSKRKRSDAVPATSKRVRTRRGKPTNPPSESANPPTEDTTSKPTTEDATPNTSEPTTKSRFIVFVGNLPYTTTAAGLTSHFSAVSPTSVRVMTTKPNGTEKPRCKGFAFLEFASYDKMELCLTKFHHTLFEGRKINIELTAGGGGKKSSIRREKLVAKNSKLNEERKRLAEGRKAEKSSNATKEDQSGIHPSRRGRMQ